MHRFLIMLYEIRKNKALAISLAALALFVVFGVLAFLRIGTLTTEIEEYKAGVMVLNDRIEYYEDIEERNRGFGEDIIELLGENEELSEKIDGLAAEIEGLTAANEELAAANEELTATNSELAAANDELERLNGELTKKLNGLRPN